MNRAWEKEPKYRPRQRGVWAMKFPPFGSRRLAPASATDSHNWRHSRFDLFPFFRLVAVKEIRACPGLKALTSHMSIVIRRRFNILANTAVKLTLGVSVAVAPAGGGGPLSGVN